MIIGIRVILFNWVTTATAVANKFFLVAIFSLEMLVESFILKTAVKS